MLLWYKFQWSAWRGFVRGHPVKVIVIVKVKVFVSTNTLNFSLTQEIVICCFSF